MTVGDTSDVRPGLTSAVSFHDIAPPTTSPKVDDAGPVGFSHTDAQPSHTVRNSIMNNVRKRWLMSGLLRAPRLSHKYAACQRRATIATRHRHKHVYPPRWLTDSFSRTRTPHQQ